jgi:5-methyltetrahydrofolate--homocysteine methyltransferase
VTDHATTLLRSHSGTEVRIGDDHPFVIIGERINPTGRKKLADQLKQGNYDTVRADALAQIDAGAKVLDLNAGIPGFDEVAMLCEMVRIVNGLVDAPICIDSSTPEALEAAVPLAGGKVLINSVTAEQHSMDRLLPLVAAHGAAVIGMANDEGGISMDPDVRFAAAAKVVENAERHGIAREDVIIDPLAMPIGAAPDAGTAMLATMRRIREELGVNLSCGASNISFGMPGRHEIDATFLVLMIGAGMHTAITNPLRRPVKKAILAADLLLGHDEYGSEWIRDHRADLAVAEEAEGPGA